MIRYLLALLLVTTSGVAKATTYFNPAPHTILNGTTGNASDVNGNFNQIISDGNAGNTTILANIAALGSGGLPTGAIIAVNASSCPPGWSKADGSSGTVDLRGVYIRGLDTGAGRDSGRVLASYQADLFKDHNHSITPLGVSITTSNLATNTSNSLIDSVSLGGVSSTIGIATGNTDVETRPDSVVYLHCQLQAASAVTSTFFSNVPVDFTGAKVVPNATDVMTDYNQIINDGNNAYNNIQNQINNFSGIPSGAVMPFNQSSCPTGWVASNGSGGTVDLRGRFINMATSGAVGGVSSYTVGDHTNNFSNVSLTFALNYVNQSRHVQAGAIAAMTGMNTLATTGNVNSGNAGSETRPQNVALLYCQKS